MSSSAKPVMEDGDIELVKQSKEQRGIATTTTDHSSVTQNKQTGKKCAIILVTLIAAFAILVIIAVFAAMMVFYPQTIARESNSEIETLRQQVENLMSQIQQSNASSIQANIREEILRQGIQEMIENVIQEQQLQSNSSQQAIQEVEKMQGKLDNMDKKFSRKLEQFELQLDNKSAEIHTGIETLLGKVNKTATDIQTLKLEVQTSNTAIQDLQYTLNATQVQLHGNLSKVTETIETVNQQLNSVEAQINQTQENVDVISFDLPEMFENITTPLVMNIDQLSYRMNISIETVAMQFADAIHDLEQRLNQSQSDHDQGK